MLVNRGTGSAQNWRSFRVVRVQKFERYAGLLVSLFKLMLYSTEFFLTRKVYWDLKIVLKSCCESNFRSKFRLPQANHWSLDGPNVFSDASPRLDWWPIWNTIEQNFENSLGISIETGPPTARRAPVNDDVKAHSQIASTSAEPPRSFPSLSKDGEDPSHLSRRGEVLNPHVSRIPREKAASPLIFSWCNPSSPIYRRF